MKKLIILLMLIFICAFQVSAQSKMNDWPELKVFHGVISQTFHPSEEGNLSPLKERSAELEEKAKTLSDSKIPVDFDNEKVKKALKNLEKETKELHKMVSQKKSDKELTTKLAEVHDTFHEIVGLCNHDSEDK